MAKSCWDIFVRTNWLTKAAITRATLQAWLTIVLPNVDDRLKNSSLIADITVDPELNSYELLDLKSGTAYEVQISGFTRAGEEVRSKESLFKTTSQGSTKQLFNQ